MKRSTLFLSKVRGSFQPACVHKSIHLPTVLFIIYTKVRCLLQVVMSQQFTEAYYLHHKLLLANCIVGIFCDILV